MNDKKKVGFFKRLWMGWKGTKMRFFNFLAGKAQNFVTKFFKRQAEKEAVRVSIATVAFDLDNEKVAEKAAEVLGYKSYQDLDDAMREAIINNDLGGLGATVLPVDKLIKVALRATAFYGAWEVFGLLKATGMIIASSGVIRALVKGIKESGYNLEKFVLEISAMFEAFLGERIDADTDEEGEGGEEEIPSPA